MTPASADEARTSRGTYAKGDRRRQEILDMAAAIVAENGVASASLRAIADRIGVSHATLQHHFRTREDLLREVFHRAETRAIAERQPPAADSVVGRMMRATEHNRELPDLTSLYFTLLGRAIESEGATREFISARFADRRGEIAQALRAEVESGLAPVDLPVEAMAALLVAAADGLQIQRALDPAVDVSEALSILGDVARAAPPTA